MTTTNIKFFAEEFLNGKYSSTDVKTQIDAGWYDWFCKESSLANKTAKLGKKVLQLMNSDKIDSENQYVFFKNNCPCSGPLYDDFRICNVEDGRVVYTVVPRSGHSEKAEVWGHENDFNEPLVQGSWKDVKTFFGVK